MLRSKTRACDRSSVKASLPDHGTMELGGAGGAGGWDYWFIDLLITANWGIFGVGAPARVH